MSQPPKLLKLVEQSGGATCLDQGLPVLRTFRALWQKAIRSCPLPPRPLFDVALVRENWHSLALILVA
jgi:hypothetical protein